MTSNTNTPTTEAPAFQLKGGLYTLSALQLLNPTLTNFAAQLDNKIQQAPKFFHNAPIVIDLIKIGRPGQNLNFLALKEILISRRLIPVGVKGGTAEQHAGAIAAGFALLSDGTGSKGEKESASFSIEPRTETQNKIKTAEQDKKTREGKAEGKSVGKSVGKSEGQAVGKAEEKAESKSVETGEIRGTNTRVITEPVRSGQQIYARGGDLLVLAPVSHGAELLADGHIHVYGPLRGRALAGVTGDTEAHIFCQSLEAELVSIAGQYKISEDMENGAWEVAVDISLQGERLHIRAL